MKNKFFLTRRAAFLATHITSIRVLKIKTIALAAIVFFIFSVSLLSGGPVVDTRLYKVSRADWIRLNGPTQGSTPTFQWTGTFDGAFNNAPFGYAGITTLPGKPPGLCGAVNTASTPALKQTNQTLV